MPIVWITLPFILAFACYGEIRERRIPNWLTLGAIALGLGAAAIEGGGEGLVDSALGLALAGGLFLPFCLLGVVGGGDMKLMAAVGAIVGWPMALRVVCDTCIAGGLIAVAMMAWKDNLRDAAPQPGPEESADGPVRPRDNDRHPRRRVRPGAIGAHTCSSG